jgi:hypothetical protein
VLALVLVQHGLLLRMHRSRVLLQRQLPVVGLLGLLGLLGM